MSKKARQPAFKSVHDIIVADNLRQWHLSRINQWLAGVPRISLERVIYSLKVQRAITDILGDGLYLTLPKKEAAMLKAVGFSYGR